MPKVQKQVEIESSGYDLIEALASAVKAAKAAKASGAALPAQIASDLIAAVSAFAPVASEIGQVGGDISEDKVAFIKGANVALYDLVESFIG